jgi:hypothetical protein
MLHTSETEDLVGNSSVWKYRGILITTSLRAKTEACPPFLFFSLTGLLTLSSFDTRSMLE